MASAHDILDQIPASFRRGGLVRFATHANEQLSSQEAGILWQTRLERGEFPLRSVIELCFENGFSLGTSLALRAVQRAQKTGAWVAYVDASASLFAPGVAASGVALERFLVLRPKGESLERVILRIMEAHLFPLVVVDLLGVAPALARGPMQSEGALDEIAGLPRVKLLRVVRRGLQAVERFGGQVLFLTQPSLGLPLPVSQKIELKRVASGLCEFEVKKDREGMLCGQTQLRWARPSISVPISMAQDKRRARFSQISSLKQI